MVIRMRSVFGWGLPPGCGRLPGEEPQPPSCEDCPEERFEKCPGQDKCVEVVLDGHLACCVEHKVEVSGMCGECEADVWATLELDLTKASDRVRLLKAGFTKNYPKRIEKLYLESVGIKVKGIKIYEAYVFAGEIYELGVVLEQI